MSILALGLVLREIQCCGIDKGGGNLSPVVIEEMLMNLTIAGINISDYFSSAQQDKYKAGFCGERCYKAIFKRLRKDMAIKSKKIEMAKTPSFLRRV